MDTLERVRYGRWARWLAIRYDWPLPLAFQVVWWRWFLDHCGHPDWQPPLPMEEHD